MSFSKVFFKLWQSVTMRKNMPCSRHGTFVKSIPQLGPPVQNCDTEFLGQRRSAEESNWMKLDIGRLFL